MYRDRLRYLQETREETLAMVAELSQEQMDHARAQRWSVGEILHHLVLSEQFLRGQIDLLIRLHNAGAEPRIRVSATSLNLSPVFIPKFFLPFLDVPLKLANMFLPNAVLAVIVQYRLVHIQHADRLAPTKGLPATELCRNLRGGFFETKALLDSHPSIDYRRLIQDHPLLGTNNALELIRFCALHEKRHPAQIRTALKDSI